MDLATWMRSFTIRTRMHGAIALVLLMFAALGLTGLFGGRQLMTLNADFTSHAMHDLQHVSAIRQALADVRLEEKQMVIAYEDPEQVKQFRQRWDAAAQRLEAALQSLQEGKREDNNGSGPWYEAGAELAAAWTSSSGFQIGVSAAYLIGKGENVIDFADARIEYTYEVSGLFPQAFIGLRF